MPAVVAPDLDKVIRQYVRPPSRPNPAPVYYNGGQNTSGVVVTTEGEEDVPTLEWEATCGTEVTTLGARGYVLKIPDTDDDPDVFQIEDFRITHVERVFGDDGESFVDLDVIDRIDFRNKAELVRKFILGGGR